MTPEQFHTELGYRMAFDDVMNTVNEMLDTDERDIWSFWTRINEQFEIRKLDGFTLSEDIAKVVNSDKK